MSASDNDSDREFAYGRNEIYEHDTCCPAVAAGFEPGPENRALRMVAEKYDEIVKQNLKEEKKWHNRGKVDWNGRGIIIERLASQAWEETINHFRDNNSPALAELATDVAEELGWR